jgi:integrase
LDETVAELIRARREEFPSAKYLFETSQGTRFEEKNVRDDFKKLFDTLGIVGDTGEGVSTHCFRHTYATTCLNDDVPITTVSLWLGHRNIQMTMRYFHRIKALTDSQIKKVKFVG